MTGEIDTSSDSLYSRGADSAGFRGEYPDEGFSRAVERFAEQHVSGLTRRNDGVILTGDQTDERD